MPYKMFRFANSKKNVISRGFANTPVKELSMLIQTSNLSGDGVTSPTSRSNWRAPFTLHVGIFMGRALLGCATGC